MLFHVTIRSSKYYVLQVISIVIVKGDKCHVQKIKGRRNGRFGSSAPRCLALKQRSGAAIRPIMASTCHTTRVFILCRLIGSTLNDPVFAKVRFHAAG